MFFAPRLELISAGIDLWSKMHTNCLMATLVVIVSVTSSCICGYSIAQAKSLSDLTRKHEESCPWKVKATGAVTYDMFTDPCTSNQREQCYGELTDIGMYEAVESLPPTCHIDRTSFVVDVGSKGIPATPAHRWRCGLTIPTRRETCRVALCDHAQWQEEQPG